MNVPLWSDHSYTSLLVQKMERAKRIENGSYWPTMQEVFAHDMQTLPLERFKVWGSVWNVPFVHSHIPREYVWTYLNAIHTSPHAALYQRAVMEPMVGCTPADFHDYLSLFGDTHENATRVQHLAHLILCGFTPDRLAQMDMIVELGSGIGEMPDIVRQLGFKGKYVIFDLPEVSAIQRWYHRQLGHTETFYTNDPTTLPKADLCIATWSLTEMPFPLRDTLMAALNGTPEWLLAYSKRIFGLDNEAWIQNTFLPPFQDRTDVTTMLLDIPYMPWNGGTKYCAVRRLAS